MEVFVYYLAEIKEGVLQNGIDRSVNHRFITQ